MDHIMSAVFLVVDQWKNLNSCSDSKKNLSQEISSNSSDLKLKLPLVETKDNSQVETKSDLSDYNNHLMLIHMLMGD